MGEAIPAGRQAQDQVLRVGGRCRAGIGHASPCARPADWLERRGQRQVASNAKYHNGNHSGRVVTKLFSVARDQYLEDHAAEWSADHRKSLRAMLLRHTAPLDNKPVGEITEDDVIPLLKPIWKGPNSTTGNRVRGMIEHIISSTGRIADNPARWTVLQYRLPRVVQAYQPKSRDMMPIEQIPAFMAKLAADTSVQSRALQFIILTAARQDEALEAAATNSTLPPRFGHAERADEDAAGAHRSVVGCCD